MNKQNIEKWRHEFEIIKTSDFENLILNLSFTTLEEDILEILKQMLNLFLEKPVSFKKLKITYKNNWRIRELKTIILKFHQKINRTDEYEEWQSIVHSHIVSDHLKIFFNELGIISKK